MRYKQSVSGSQVSPPRPLQHHNPPRSPAIHPISTNGNLHRLQRSLPILPTPTHFRITILHQLNRSRRPSLCRPLSLLAL